MSRCRRLISARASVQKSTQASNHGSPPSIPSSSAASSSPLTTGRRVTTATPPHRADGTLLAFQNHQRFNDPLPQPGQRDITAQVDFTAFGRLAQEVGFELLGYSDQHHFLVGAAEPWPRSLGDSQIREMLQGRISAPFRPFSTPARWVSSSRQLPLGKTFQQGLPSPASSMRARGLAYFELNVSRGGAEARSGIKEGYPVHPLG